MTNEGICSFSNTDFVKYCTNDKMLVSFKNRIMEHALNAMDRAIAGATSGENAVIGSAEGFTISGKRTEV